MLTYALSTNPLPLQAGSTGSAPAVLTLTATNGGKDAYPLPSLSIQLPTGASAAALTDQPTALQPTPPAGWTLKQTQTGTDPATKLGFVLYVFYPPAGTSSLASHAALVFTFLNLLPTATPGTAELLVFEGAQPQPLTLPLTKFPAGWGVVSFEVSPLSVQAGFPVTLTWSGPAGATYALQATSLATASTVTLPAGSNQPLGNDGKLTDAPAQTTAYTLQVNDVVNGQSFHAEQQFTVAVAVPIPTVQLSASTQYVDLGPPSTPVTLSWTTANVSKLEIDGVMSIPPDQIAQGSAVVHPQTSTVYKATGYGLLGSTQPPATGDVTVYAASRSSIESFLITAGTDTKSLAFTTKAGGVTFNFDLVSISPGLPQWAPGPITSFSMQSNSSQGLKFAGVQGAAYSSMNCDLQPDPTTGFAITSLGPPQELLDNPYNYIRTLSFQTLGTPGIDYKTTPTVAFNPDFSLLIADWDSLFAVQLTDGSYGFLWYDLSPVGRIQSPPSQVAFYWLHYTQIPI